MRDHLIQRRPAETVAVSAALALLIVRSLGVDDVDVVTSLAVVIGAIPAGVTWVVDRADKGKKRKR